TGSSESWPVMNPSRGCSTADRAQSPSAHIAIVSRGYIVSTVQAPAAAQLLEQPTVVLVSGVHQASQLMEALIDSGKESTMSYGDKPSDKLHAVPCRWRS